MSADEPQTSGLLFLGRLAGGLVHEIKNPLSTLSNDFLRYAGMRRLDRKPCDLRTVVRELADFVGPGFRRDGIELVVDVPSVDVELDAPLFKNSNKPIAELINDIPNLKKSGIDRAKAKAELLNSPIFRELVISADGRTTALLLGLVEEKRYNKLLQSRNELRSKKRKSGLTTKEKEALERINIEYDQAHDALSEQRHLSVGHIRDILKTYREHGVLHLGGVPMITDDMVTFVRNDLIVFGGGVFIFLVLVLTLIFREFLWIVLPLLSCGYAGLIMMGVLGFAGWKVTVISSNFLALMLIITISMNIHLIVRYRQLNRDNPDEDQV